MNNQYSLKISALKHVGNVSVNSKPDHPPWQNPWEIFLMGEFSTLGHKKSSKLPAPGPIKQAKTHPQGHFLNYSQYNMKKWDKNDVKLYNFIIIR